ncbi:segregation and condensation protein A [Amnibacterium endophyticum]|uniref:Segregation and condensation protein A n=1 Tax=Amnibacterium endophyticum TaxID=2109337 RepID=A0ABW4LCI5_9MICO
MSAPERSVEPAAEVFRVRVGGFDGPFDLLLDLIGRHELEVTALSLSAVTDEFLAHLGRLGDAVGLETQSSFLVVGTTLLDAKIAGLLPQGEAVDPEAVAVLEARDLLFARLLQYRAYREASAWFGDAFETEASRHAHPGSLEDRVRPAAPPAEVPLDLAAFALLAASALTPRPVPTVGTDHLHAPPERVRLHAAEVVALLRDGRPRAFLELTGPDATRAVVVARFLAVLELHRQSAIVLEQVDPLGALVVRWTATDWDDTRLESLGGDADDG